jgi:hypothetical protein
VAKGAPLIRDTLIIDVWLQVVTRMMVMIMLMVMFLIFFPFRKGTFGLTTRVNAKTWPSTSNNNLTN